MIREGWNVGCEWRPDGVETISPMVPLGRNDARTVSLRHVNHFKRATHVRDHLSGALVGRWGMRPPQMADGWFISIPEPAGDGTHALTTSAYVHCGIQYSVTMCRIRVLSTRGRELMFGPCHNCGR